MPLVGGLGVHTPLFRLLGTLRVEADGAEIPIRGYKTRTALAVLLLSAGRVVSSDRLSDALWGDGRPGDAAHALHVHVSSLRGALGGYREVLQTRPPGYLLNVDPEQIDIARFERLVGEGRRCLEEGSAVEAARVLDVALGLWSGPALADFSSELFAAGAAARLEDLRLSAREARIAADLDLGRAAERVGELELLTREDPMRERLWFLLMSALYRANRQADALFAFQEARRYLVDELGLEPGPELQVLHRAILAHDDGILRRGERMPQRRARVEHNIPAAFTPLVGRTDEASELARLLRQPDTHLVTIVGAPGIGKTRLAMAAAELVLDAFDIVQVTMLAAVRESGLVAASVAAGLGARVSEPGLVTDALLRALGARRALLVLDNFEHVLSAAPIITDLLARGTAIKVLATSRAPLRLSAERLFPLRPLATADPTRVNNAEDLADAPAPVLFIDRARASDPMFEVDGPTARVVAAICARLDGLPLAIELAAARTRVYRPPELLRELDHRLALLTGGAVDLPDRQQTLRAALDWSYELLTDREQTLLAQLAVFVGGFTLPAVRAVAGDAHQDVRDTLTGLLDNSLVTREAGHGSLRFEMLETIREYALERLAALADEETVRPRHARHFLSVAEQAQQSSSSESGHEGLRRELGNFRAALRWAHETPDPELLGRLIVGLQAVFLAWGDPETRGWLEAAASTPGVPSRVAADIDLALATFALYRADWSEATKRATRCLKRFRALGHVRGAAEAQRLLAGIARVTGTREEAEALLKESYAAAKGLGDRRLCGRIMYNLAVVALEAADWGECAERASAAERVFRELGDVDLLVQALGVLGEAEDARGNTALARRILEDAMVLIGPEGGRTIVDVTRILASLCAVEEPRRAESLLRRAVATATALESRAQLPDLLVVLSEVRSGQGRHTEAMTLIGAAQADATALAGTSGAGVIVGRERAALKRVRAAAEQALGLEEADLHLRHGHGLAPLDAFTLAGGDPAPAATHSTPG